MAQSFTLPFLKKEKVAKNTYSFYFDRVKRGSVVQDEFDFIPGQYVRMILPHKNADDRGTSRYFTISSSPTEKKLLIVTVRIFQSTFKDTLLHLYPGEKVEFFGPMGWFLLPKDEQEEKVFIAGSIGVTPFHSLLHSVVDTTLSKSMTLFASFSTKEEVVFYEAFQAIAKENKDIKVIYTLTQDNNSDWKGERGRISHDLLKKHIGDLQKPVFYVVGSEKMVAGVKALLLDLGIAEEKIQTEDFTGY